MAKVGGPQPMNQLEQHLGASALQAGPGRQRGKPYAAERVVEACRVSGAAMGHGLLSLPGRVAASNLAS